MSGTNALAKRAPVIFKVALAWLPFYVMWAVFILAYTGGEVGLAEALASGALAIGTAAVLGFFVWRFTGRFPWPDRIRLRFYLIQLLAGISFASAWLVIVYTIEIISFGADPATFIEEVSRVLGWQLLMGLWIYGGVAAVSYAVRIRERLREQERIAASAQALAAKAQLKALKAQLNPHFLFNALHSVSFLVQEDPEEADAAIDQLGGLLRYALDEGVNDEVLLMDEWAFTSAYLDLESIRFGSRLRVDADLDPDAMGCAVPPFSLQPLVENCVQHCIDPRPEGGLIQIRASLDGVKLIVTVQDDGPGSDTMRDVDEGHGLGDLRRRLAALCGDEATVEVTTGSGHGFLVTLTLPAGERDEHEQGTVAAAEAESNLEPVS